MKNKYSLQFTLLALLFFCFKPEQTFAWGWEDFKEESLSPFTTDSKYILLTGGALTLVSAISKDNSVTPIQNWFQDKKPLGEWSKYGDYAGQLIPNGLYVIGQGIAGYSGNELGYKRALGMFKATLYASSVTTILKYTIREPRPDNHKEKNSFPSGHSTTVFAFAGYVWGEHGWKWGVPATALATFTGASRINDNRHFLHDVFAGATIGLAYGYGISALEKKKSDHSVMIVPIYQHDTKGIALVREF